MERWVDLPRPIAAMTSLPSLPRFLIVASAVAAGCAASGTGSAAEVEFGMRPVTGGYWNAEVRVENTTASPLSLAPGMTIQGSEAADFSARVRGSGTVPPGGQLVIRITFNPSAAGPRAAQLAVPTDSAVIGTVTFPLSGEGGDYPETVLDAPGTHQWGGAAAGSLRLQAGILELTSDLTVEGDLILAGGGVNLNGFRLAAGRDIRFTGGVVVTAGGGTEFKAGGHLYLQAGQLVVNGPGVEVAGDFRVQTVSELSEGNLSFGVSGGVVAMTTPPAHLIVNGDFITDSAASHNGQLTAGTLELRGDFQQFSNNAGNDPQARANFHATGTHRVLLTGTALQTLSFTNPGGNSAFQTLEIATGSAVEHLPTLNCYTLVTNGHPLTGGVAFGSLDFTLTENLAVAGDMMLNASVLHLGGRTLQVQGTLRHAGGRVVVGSGKLETTGDYRIQSAANGPSGGVLTMTDEAGRVVVGGDFITDSASSHNGHLTAGTLELRGDFQQFSNNAGNDPQARANFHATGTHRVLLTGTAPQTLFFTNPGGNSAFQWLEIATGSAVEHLPTLNCYTLVTNGHPLTGGVAFGSLDFTLTENLAVAGDMMLNASVLHLGGRTLQVQGTLRHAGGRVVVGSGKLETTGDYRIQSAANGPSGGVLTMTDEAGRVVVGGDFITDSASSHNGHLTAGTLELRGDFQQFSNNAGNDPQARANFHATGTHRVLLTGTALQTLSFTNPGGNSAFQTLEIATGSAVEHLPTLNCYTLVTNGHPLTGGVAFGSLDFTLTENLAVAGDMMLNASVLHLGGRTLQVQGTLRHAGGRVVVGSGKLETTGDYRIQSAANGPSGGVLTMTDEAGRVVVGGDFITDSASSHNGHLTAGTLELRGDFQQFSNNAGNDPQARSNFYTTATHRVILTGGGDQHVAFVNPDSSRFTVLELLSNPAATVTFDTRTVVTTLFDHHLRNFVIAPGAPATDFPDSDGDGLRDPQEAFPAGDGDNNNVPDWATAQSYRYEDWAALFFWQGDPNLAQISAPDADPDADGVPNALEYVMASIPTRGGPPRYTLSLSTVAGQPRLTLTWPRVKVSTGSVASTAVTGGTLQAGSWTPVNSEVISDDGQVEMLRAIDTAPVVAGGRHFMALRGAK